MNGRFFGRILFLLILITMIGGCSYWGNSRTLADYLGLDWEAGDNWEVHYQAWPERFGDPDTQVSTSFETRIDFKVMSNQSGETRVQYSTIVSPERYILTFDNKPNTLSSSRLIGRQKLKELHSNKFGRTAFFNPLSPPSAAVIRFFPDMSMGINQSRKRLVDSDRGRSDFDWITQTLLKDSGKVTIWLEHPPSKNEVKITWNRGQNWWSSLRWYRHSRLLVYAYQPNY